jgi:hypothetical protein
MVNPFEPPRAADAAIPGLDAQPTSAVPEAAVSELVASAPWARWSARLAVLSILGSVVNMGVALARPGPPAQKITSVVSVLIALPVAILFVVLFRRYASEAERLGARQPGALPGVVDAQRALFKTYGILTIVAMAFVPLAIIAGIIGAVAMKGGR